jgi:macrophage erythroblast attacher
LEFDLRLQEYVELVRSKNIAGALVFVKKFLQPWSDTHMKEIELAMGLLAFSPNTETERYKALYQHERWAALEEKFLAENYQLNSMSKKSLLQITLEAGLAALKTRQCVKNGNLECPACYYHELAESVPLAHFVNSCLVDSHSGEIMNHDNPPLVLPNGNVFSTHVT